MQSSRTASVLAGAFLAGFAGLLFWQSQSRQPQGASDKPEVAHSMPFHRPPDFYPEGYSEGRPRRFGGAFHPMFAVQRMADTNRDGQITPDEIEELNARLTELDQDLDGTISAEEMRRGLGWPDGSPFNRVPGDAGPAHRELPQL